jgi:para-nitrobenzyl esterase
MESAASGPVVQTTAGKIRGFEIDGTKIFLGVPYGAAPVGPDRFRRPRPPEMWSEIRDARRFGPAAMQFPEDPSATSLPPETEFSEDCLTLNVWSPGTSGDRLPVMVWLHGGGYRTGGTGVRAYDGARLARHGQVVVVSCGYRLGALGFLAHPDLAEDGSSGNWGLFDQRLALEWVRDNVSQFGGDPGRVTIFGESAGGNAVCLHLAARADPRLFHRAIAQSGSTKVEDPDAAAARAERMAELLGCGKVRGLRDMPASALRNAQAEIEGAVQGMAFLPLVDGAFLTGDPLALVREGSAASVPVILGTNLDEWRLFQRHLDPGGRTIDDRQLLRRAQRSFGEAAGEIIECCRREREAACRGTVPGGVVAGGAVAGGGGGPDRRIDPGALWYAIAGDAYFLLPMDRMREAMHAGGGSVWSYLFTWPSPGEGGWLRACHTLEIPFVFGTLDGSADLAEFTGSGPAARALSDQMILAWSAFARDGDPARVGTVPWPAWDPEGKATLMIGSDVGVALAPQARELETLAAHLPDASLRLRIESG